MTTPSLSVCCLTSDPLERVATMLGFLRPVAGEVVVALDARVDRSELRALADVADRVYRVPYEPPPERYLAWLHSLCRGKWIFRIDGDEVPSRGLVDALPELCRAADVLQYRIPRRWLFPGPQTWLEEPPWYPAYQIRIVRNDPATLRFPGILHTSAEALLPARYLREPLYHLLLLDEPAESREQRVHTYSRLVQAGVVEDNAAVYVPERRDRHRLAEVPEEDQRLLEAAMRPPPTSASGEAVRPIEVSQAEVDRLWTARPLEPGAYAARIEPLVGPQELEPGQEVELPVVVTNCSSETFPWSLVHPDVRLGYRWLSPDGDARVAEGVHRTRLPAPLASGAETVVSVHVAAPASEGPFVLEIDLVHEGVRWFECSARVDVVVGARERPAARGVEPIAGGPARFVCVVGMHRSGTSLVARLVNLLGADLGEERDFLAPAADNPAGFWENRFVVQLNDELLSILGGSTVEPPLLPDGWEHQPELASVRDRARAVLSRSFTRAVPVAAWKDPRTSLTLPFWLTVAPITDAVICIRRPMEVARSLAARDGTGADWASHLWIRYVVAAFRAPVRKLVVRYDDFFERPDDVIEQLAGVVGEAADGVDRGSVRGAIDESLRHQRVEAGGRPNDPTTALAEALYELVSTHEEDAVRPILDAVNEDLLLKAEAGALRARLESLERELQPS
jgi:hypothetical protein